MLKDLEEGKIIGLSKSQRSWAESKYLDLKLDREEHLPQPPPRTQKSKPVPTFEWEKNLPLKPPGK